MSLRNRMRVAIIHDWLFHMRGGEKCLRDLCLMFPDSEIFTLFYEPDAILAEEISSRPIHASHLNNNSFLRGHYRKLLPLYPLASWLLSRKLAARHRAQAFDLVISVSHCAAKNVAIPSGVVHLCYCLSPARYLWDQFERYIKSPALRFFATPLRKLLQHWDVRGAGRVDTFIAISSFVAERIKRVYGRESSVVYPGVELDPRISPSPGPEVEFLVVNALVPYKNTEAIVLAFNSLGLPLRVVGKGSELARLKKIAGTSIEFEEDLSSERLWELYHNCIALVFAAEEDFGMTPVEAQSSGRPVICYGRGGARETVIDGETGLFFGELSPESIALAVKQFLDCRERFKLERLRENAEQFSRERFFENMARIIRHPTERRVGNA